MHIPHSYRRRSTSIAGIAGAGPSPGLFEYRFLVSHLAVGSAFGSARVSCRQVRSVGVVIFHELAGHALTALP